MIYTVRLVKSDKDGEYYYHIVNKNGSVQKSKYYPYPVRVTKSGGLQYRKDLLLGLIKTENWSKEFIIGKGFNDDIFWAMSQRKKWEAILIFIVIFGIWILLTPNGL